MKTNPVKDIFQQYYKNKKNIEMSIDTMKKDLDKFDRKILLYGAGSSGIAFLYFLKRINITPLYFIDSNLSKVGTKCEGIEVIDPPRASSLSLVNALVIVCINTDGKRYCKSFSEALRAGGHNAVYDNLKGAGFKNIIDYTYFRRCFSFFTEERYNAPSCSDVFLMEKNEDKIEQAFQMLEDEESRNIYKKILTFRLLDDSITIPTLTQDKQYFEYGFYERRHDEIFIDCGAFNGISLKMFLKENEWKFSQYYGIEPDVNNYIRLQEYIKAIPKEYQNKIQIMKAAAWKNTQGARLYKLSGPGSFIADIGQDNIDTITIDGMLDGKKATYIKMNIEGSEKEALYGASQTINGYKPNLAIAGYHQTEDLWEVPIIMKEYCKEYKIFLRSYMNHISFVYYGV